MGCAVAAAVAAEEVACGMHHVAVVASKVQANGRILPEARRSRLLTWGKGGQGQLGVDTYKDYNLPQVRDACMRACTRDEGPSVQVWAERPAPYCASCTHAEGAVASELEVPPCHCHGCRWCPASTGGAS